VLAQWGMGLCRQTSALLLQTLTALLAHNYLHEVSQLSTGTPSEASEALHTHMQSCFCGAT